MSTKVPACLFLKPMEKARVGVMLSGCLLFSSLVLSSCYYFTQGRYFFHHRNSARSITAMLKEKTTPSSTKAFFRRVLDIKKFTKQLHLSEDKNYMHYTVLARDYLVAVVHAAGKTSLEPYMWNYPFLGSLPYRGYYKEKDAKKESESLQRKGYETYIRKVHAFSSLRMMSDPLYSFMEDYEVGELAELIIHEQTHSTIWLRNNSSFNEQLARFIGNEGAKRYLDHVYGKHSKEYRLYVDALDDRSTLLLFLRDVAHALDELYQNKNFSVDEKLRKRKKILEEWQRRYVENYDKNYRRNHYKGIDITKRNNAFFSYVSVYTPRSSSFEEALVRCGNDIASFVKAMIPVRKPPHNKNPKNFMETVCSSRSTLFDSPP